MSTDQIDGPSDAPPTGDVPASATKPSAAEAVTPAPAEPPAAGSADADPAGAEPTTTERDATDTAAVVAPAATPAEVPPAGPDHPSSTGQADPSPAKPADPLSYGPDDLASAGGPAERPKKRWPLPVRIAVGVLGALVTMALINGGKSVLRSLADEDHINNVTAGDCVRESPGDRNSPYRIVGCDDAAATHKALQVAASSSDGSCIHVAGATRSITNETGNVCIGPKDVDPARAVNVAKEGDCLGQTGDETYRVDCSGADAEYTVLKRFDNVLKAETETACDDVPGAVGTYSWDWESELSANLLPDVVDVLLCLGEK
ncbi:LppU/SCO3897 family protein [Plantactinospora sonchi]|uniref:Serine/threonine protein kinase n=1 Tax=Plantactinospora sonchi TaxID=1544735 RepID=A0ABU7RQ01_9ACTN